MTRDELTSLGRRLYDAAYEVIIGPKSKGGNVSADPNAVPDPRDERITELEAQLAQAQSTDKPADTATDADKPAEEPTETASVTYEDAKAKVDAGEELTDADVAALERGRPITG